MMTQQLEVSILTAPVAAIDRRSLSQAWYSALHLTGRAAPQLPASAAKAIAPPKAQPAREKGAPPVGRPSGLSTASAAAVAPKRQKPAAVVDWDRRAPRTLLTRLIERALLQRRSDTAKRTSFVVGNGAGRVHVMVQSRGGRLRLVAMCLPSMRATVARALDQARYALASRGIEVESCF